MPMFLSIFKAALDRFYCIKFKLHIGKGMLNSRTNKELSFSFQGLPIYEILSTVHSSFRLQVKNMLNSRTFQRPKRNSSGLPRLQVYI